MTETLNPDSQALLKKEAIVKFLLTGSEVLAGGVVATLGLIIGAPIMGATGLLLGLSFVRQGAEDLHEGLEAMKKLRNLDNK